MEGINFAARHEPMQPMRPPLERTLAYRWVYCLKYEIRNAERIKMSDCAPSQPPELARSVAGRSSSPSHCSVGWVETRKDDRWDRADGACVKIDHTVECSTSRPWLPNYRGWKAWGPGDNDLLGFKLRRSRFTIARKFKTAAAAMKAVDAEYPPNAHLSVAVTKRNERNINV